MERDTAFAIPSAKQVVDQMKRRKLRPTSTTQPRSLFFSSYPDFALHRPYSKGGGKGRFPEGLPLQLHRKALGRHVPRGAVEPPGELEPVPRAQAAARARESVRGLRPSDRGGHQVEC